MAAVAAGAVATKKAAAAAAASKQKAAAAAAAAARTPTSPRSSPPRDNSGNGIFTLSELHKATQGFNKKNKLGEGGFGKVYKGVLEDGREVAVKALTIGGGQGEREFRAEVETISRCHHRYLVTMFGYCISKDQRLLVYEYVPNGTLEAALHGEIRNHAPVLQRIRARRRL